MESTTELRPIPKCPGYFAGSDGSIWSTWKFKGVGYAGKCHQVMTDVPQRKLKPDLRKTDNRARYTVKTASGRYRRAYGSHFILEAFIGPRPRGMEACHKDGDCTNDSVGNLRWGTTVSNKDDMVGHGTRLRGEQINTAKITEDDVREIRKTGKPLKPLAEKFGVSETMISLILKRKAWKHVE